MTNWDLLLVSGFQLQCIAVGFPKQENKSPGGREHTLLTVSGEKLEERRCSCGKVQAGFQIVGENSIKQARLHASMGYTMHTKPNRKMWDSCTYRQVGRFRLSLPSEFVCLEFSALSFPSSCSQFFRGNLGQVAHLQQSFF